MADNKERTFIMIKPDGVQRGLVGKIIQRFEEKGFKLVAMKMTWVSAERDRREEPLLSGHLYRSPSSSAGHVVET